MGVCENCLQVYLQITEDSSLMRGSEDDRWALHVILLNPHCAGEAHLVHFVHIVSPGTTVLQHYCALEWVHACRGWPSSCWYPISCERPLAETQRKAQDPRLFNLGALDTGEKQKVVRQMSSFFPSIRDDLENKFQALEPTIDALDEGQFPPLCETTGHHGLLRLFGEGTQFCIEGGWYVMSQAVLWVTRYPHVTL